MFLNLAISLTFIHAQFHPCDKLHIVEHFYLCKIPFTWTIAQFIYVIKLTNKQKYIYHQVFSNKFYPYKPIACLMNFIHKHNSIHTNKFYHTFIQHVKLNNIITCINPHGWKMHHCDQTHPSNKISPIWYMSLLRSCLASWLFTNKSWWLSFFLIFSSPLLPFFSLTSSVCPFPFLSPFFPYAPSRVRPGGPSSLSCVPPSFSHMIHPKVGVASPYPHALKHVSIPQDWMV